MAPPEHRQLEQLNSYSVEPVRWDMGLVSHTMPIRKVVLPPDRSHAGASHAGLVAAPVPSTLPSTSTVVPPSAVDLDLEIDAAENQGKPAGRNLALNSMAMMLSTVVTGILGLAFWAVAGRLFPVEEVGSASAVIASAVMLATLSNLSLGSMYERFLPTAGTNARSYVLRGYLAVGSLALVLGCGFLLFAPVDQLFTSTVEIATFPLFVMVLAMFALQDQTASGLGYARWAAVKNVFHAIVKLAILAVTYETARSFTIIAAWAVPAAIAAFVLFRAISRNLKNAPRYQSAPDLPPRKELLSYFGSAYGITALGTLAPLLVPIIVVTTLGTEQNAYFALTWSIISAMYLLIGVLVGPFVAEAAAHPEQFPKLAKRFISLLLLVAVAGSFFLAVLAPFGLGIVGPDYRENGTVLVHLAAITIPLSVIGALYDGLARVRRRMALAVVVQIAATIIIIVGALALSPRMGIAGIGWAYLAAEAFGAVVLLVPLIRWLRSLSREAKAGEEATAAAVAVGTPQRRREHVRVDG